MIGLVEYQWLGLINQFISIRYMKSTWDTSDKFIIKPKLLLECKLYDFLYYFFLTRFITDFLYYNFQNKSKKYDWITYNLINTRTIPSTSKSLFKFLYWRVFSLSSLKAKKIINSVRYLYFRFHISDWYKLVYQPQPLIFNQTNHNLY